MGTVPFTWSDIITSANNFLANEFVSGVLITMIALAVVVKVAEFVRGIVE